MSFRLRRSLYAATNVAALMGSTVTDGDVTAWIAAVQGAGGTVSGTYTSALNTMVVGVKNLLGITLLSQKFDRFYFGLAGRTRFRPISTLPRELRHPSPQQWRLAH